MKNKEWLWPLIEQKLLMFKNINTATKAYSPELVVPSLFCQDLLFGLLATGTLQKVVGFYRGGGPVATQAPAGYRNNVPLGVREGNTPMMLKRKCVLQQQLEASPWI